MYNKYPDLNLNGVINIYKRYKDKLEGTVMDEYEIGRQKKKNTYLASDKFFTQILNSKEIFIDLSKLLVFLDEPYRNKNINMLEELKCQCKQLESQYNRNSTLFNEIENGQFLFNNKEFVYSQINKNIEQIGNVFEEISKKLSEEYIKLSKYVIESNVTKADLTTSNLDVFNNLTNVTK